MARPIVTQIGAVNDILAHTGVKSIPAGGYVLAATVTGTVKRGMPLKQGATDKELIPVDASADQVVAIAAATIDVSVTRAMPAYEEGEFNAHIIAGLLPAEATIAGLSVKARMHGIYFRDVVQPV